MGTSACVCGCGVRAGWNDQTNSARPPSARNCTVAAALPIVASILRRLRTMPASPISRSTSALPYAATRSGSKPANASRNAGRLRRIVAHDSPDWKASSDSRSNIPRSSRTGIPHSVS